MLYTEDRAEAEDLLNLLIRQIGEKTFRAELETLRVTMSFGAIQYGNQPAKQLVMEADALLYSAKAGGRSRIEWQG